MGGNCCRYGSKPPFIADTMVGADDIVKKRIKTLVILAVVLALVVCVPLHYLGVHLGAGYNYIGWQTVAIPEFGTIKVPRDWHVTYVDQAMYLSDRPMTEEEYKIYLAGIDIDIMYPPSNLFPGAERLYVIRGAGQTNNAGYSLDRLSIDGIEVERFSISVFTMDGLNMKTFSFIVWDDSVTERTIARITRSFRW